MSMEYPIADMLTRIRNAQMVERPAFRFRRPLKVADCPGPEGRRLALLTVSPSPVRLQSPHWKFR